MLDKIYHWMIVNLPHQIMYKNSWIDSQHKMWLPRWGWSKEQIKNAKKNADEQYDNITWK